MFGSRKEIIPSNDDRKIQVRSKFEDKHRQPDGQTKLNQYNFNHSFQGAYKDLNFHKNF